MRIYTRTGDTGDTGLFGGQRVRKDDARVAAYVDVDELNAALGLAASAVHLARAVCRRAERRIVALADAEDLGPDLLPYVNRLSDLLFVLARATNQHAGQADTPWTPHGAVEETDD